MNNRMFNIGKIVNTHGIHGEVKVVRITDFEERFKPGNTVYTAGKNEPPIQLTIESHRHHKGFDLLKFQNMNNINDIEHLKGTYLTIEEDQLTELDANEFYYHEIIGCHVYTVSEEKIGTVIEILSPGANDVWVVKRPQGKEVLIPYIEEVVKEVHTQSRKIIIEPMEGLLD
ncbi:ribosome maturation factor RimM [Virgibacillus kimchii]